MTLMFQTNLAGMSASVILDDLLSSTVSTLHCFAAALLVSIHWLNSNSNVLFHFIMIQTLFHFSFKTTDEMMVLKLISLDYRKGCITTWFYQVKYTPAALNSDR